MKITDYLTVGDMSALGFGAMRLPDVNETSKMVDLYLNSGYNYFDTAYIYTGLEELLKKALTDRHPRDSFFVANKLPPWEVKNHKDCEKIFAEQQRRTGLDYFDFYLVHSLDDSREKGVEDMGLFDWVAEQKKKGKVKHMGFSFHGSTAYLERLLERHPEAEFVQLQLNYVDILRGPAGEWQALANKYNKPIVVMEPVKGGSLAALPPKAEALFKELDPNRSIASWAVQYAATLKGTTCMLSGMSTVDQVEDNIKTFKNLRPLTSDEMEVIENVLAEMAKVSSIPCTACKYCHENCPQGIEIATCFSLYNELKRGSSHWNRSAIYKALSPDKRADACTSCAACLSHCPQHINIPEELPKVVETFK